jgi:hypothetical protein
MTVFDSTVAIGRRRTAIDRYLERRQLYPFQIGSEPSSNLGLSIVIPCFDETDLVKALNSLSQCDPPGADVEVLVVINAPDGAGPTVAENNALARAQVADVASRPHPGWLRFHVLQHDALPTESAGVGLARKIGMDEAVGRIATTRACDGVIVSLDADCEVERNFMAEIRTEFRAHPDCPGLSIYFEHRLIAERELAVHRAILNYELHMRYYVAGQRLAGFPYALHTIGSAMACRGSTYAEQGGMNRRQGGEDFYFIQKLVELGGYRSLGRTTVYPAVRASDRVPFGTGPAIRNALDSAGELNTFAPEIFQDLRYFCGALVDASPLTPEKISADLPEALARFLREAGFFDRLAEIERNVSTTEAYRKRIFRWFNGFRFLKFAQFASRHYYPKIQVSRAARELAEASGLIGPGEDLQPDDLLSRYRQLDREAIAVNLPKD